MASAAVAGQSAVPPREVRFPTRRRWTSCASSSLALRRSVDAQGRLDGSGVRWYGRAAGSHHAHGVGYADTVGRINFTGRSRINYSTRARRKTGKAGRIRSRPRSRRSSMNSSRFTRLSMKPARSARSGSIPTASASVTSAWREERLQGRRLPSTLVRDMRRSAVRAFERAGVPRSVAMSIVGHKTESIYRRYAIVDEAMQREAAARLDAWMALPATAPLTSTATPLRRSNRLRARMMTR